MTPDAIDKVRSALQTCPCPRPYNSAPDGQLVHECIAAGNCGCDNAEALAALEAWAALPESVPVTCAHDNVYFESGDYYLSCRACQSRWAMMKPGQVEYGHSASGERIGAAPELSGKLWIPATDPIRSRVLSDHSATVMAEREMCAKIIEDAMEDNHFCWKVLEELVAAIHARGQGHA